MKNILREITPLVQDNIFFTAYYPENQFDFPIHFHEDFELNLTLNGSGKRIVGNLVDSFVDSDLVLVGPNILHCYSKEAEHASVSCDVYIVQFSKELYQYPLFSTKRLKHIRDLLSRATNGGIKFSEKTVDKLKNKIIAITEKKDFDQFILFLELLNELAIAEDQEYLTLSSEQGGADVLYSLSKSRRINKIIHFVKMNYRNKILLDDIGTLIGMSASSASRFFKKKTQRNFSDFLNSYRIDCAARMLIETELFISEICYSSGFENLSNFNRAFKGLLGCTPNEYRIKYRATMIASK